MFQKPMTPSKIQKTTYFEIFNSNKDSIKRQINFLNYSNEGFNVLNNNNLD